jgi:hypothetical protein
MEAGRKLRIRVGSGKVVSLEAVEVQYEGNWAQLTQWPGLSPASATLRGHLPSPKPRFPHLQMRFRILQCSSNLTGDGKSECVLKVEGAT